MDPIFHHHNLNLTEVLAKMVSTTDLKEQLPYERQPWSFLVLYCSVAQLLALWRAVQCNRTVSYYTASLLTLIMFWIIERRAKCENPDLGCNDYIEIQNNLIKLYACCAPFYGAAYYFLSFDNTVIDFKKILGLCITLTNSPIVVFAGIIGSCDAISKLKAGQFTFLELYYPQFELFVQLAIIWFGIWLFMYSVEQLKDDLNLFTDIVDRDDEIYSEDDEVEKMLVVLEKKAEDAGLINA